MDLPYKFQGHDDNYREAADPSMVVFKDTYWLFVSKSGGYWHSKDLQNWVFVEAKGLPYGDYAPTAYVLNGKIYWTASHSGAVFTTDDPWTGPWYTVGAVDLIVHDPFFFLDDDNKSYFAWGCSNMHPIYITEIDPDDKFKLLGETKSVIWQNQSFHGWESAKFNASQSVQSAMVLKMFGDAPFIEGSWINKVNGRYIHQYAGPGTELKEYGDGVYVSDVGPMGPYVRDHHSPVSHKPTGFIAGAGHGSTFQDLQGQWWHISTGLIGVRYNFERRLMLSPAYFEADKIPAEFKHGEMTDVPSMLVDTMQGDFPMRFDQTKPGWQHLSLFKEVTVSSTLSDEYRASFAVDEDIMTWWTAEGDTGSGEWLAVDIGHEATLHAVQINTADHDAVAPGVLYDAYMYFVETSLDGEVWTMLGEMDRRENTRDSPHDYTELATPVVLRHFRITSSCIPAGARFSISGLRLFGFGAGKAPEAVQTVAVSRNFKDRREATIQWPAVDRAEYYVLRWGVHGGPLFQPYSVFGGETKAFIASLSTDVTYDFVVDAVNEAGLTRGTSLKTA